MQETQVQSLGQEEPLEKETATHSSVLAWEIPWTKEPCGLQSAGSQRIGHDLDTKQKVLVVQSCPALCLPMNSSLPGSSVHGIL